MLSLTRFSNSIHYIHQRNTNFFFFFFYIIIEAPHTYWIIFLITAEGMCLDPQYNIRQCHLIQNTTSHPSLSTLCVWDLIYLSQKTTNTCLINFTSSPVGYKKKLATSLNCCHPDVPLDPIPSKCA